MVHQIFIYFILISLLLPTPGLLESDALPNVTGHIITTKSAINSSTSDIMAEYSILRYSASCNNIGMNNKFQVKLN